MNVLFVCDGNICRSPLAACYLRFRAERLGISDLLVDSAGLLGIRGAAPAAFSVEVARDAGMDLTLHRSRGVTIADIHGADWVVAMTSAHLATLARRFPVRSERRVLVRAFENGPTPVPQAPDLDDPITGPIEGYREAFAIIRTSIDHFVTQLRRAT